MPLQDAKRCCHIQVTGHQCGSPALKNRQFCYFHERILRGVALPRHARVQPMFVLETEESIQFAIMEVMNAIVMNRMEYKATSLLLRALNIAARNSRNTRFGDRPREMVHELPEDAAQLPDPDPAEPPIDNLVGASKPAALPALKSAPKPDRKPAASMSTPKPLASPLTNRQANQWGEIRGLQKSMEGAIRGNFEDVKTCFEAAGLYPPRPRQREAIGVQGSATNSVSANERGVMLYERNYFKLPS
jgi:hypothetical protein